MFNPKKIGKRLIHIRQKKGLTQNEMAADLHISRSYLCNVENGVRIPSIDLLVDIAEQYEVSLDYLILGKDLNTQRAKLIKETQTAMNLLHEAESILDAQKKHLF